MLTLNVRSRRLLIFGSLSMGIILAFGFIPACYRLYLFYLSILGRPFQPLEQFLAFPALATLFFISIPKARTPLSTSWNWWRTLFCALVIALAYGAVGGNLNIFELARTESGSLSIWWIVLIAPIGEELLFRGWVYNFAARVWGHQPFSLTNSLPAPVWASAIAFSFWHLQNLAIGSLAFVGFQVAYTLFTGLWLGYLRYRTASLLPPLIAHICLNLASLLI